MYIHVRGSGSPFLSVFTSSKIFQILSHRLKRIIRKDGPFLVDLSECTYSVLDEKNADCRKKFRNKSCNICLNHDMLFMKKMRNAAKISGGARRCSMHESNT